VVHPLLLLLKLLRGGGVGDLALVLALASLVFSAWSGVGTLAACSYRDCDHTGREDPQPRSSMTWGPRRWRRRCHCLLGVA
jgi:hypothetical protein